MVPLTISWQGRPLRVRHDDLHLSPDIPRASVIRAAVELVSDTEGLRLVLTSALGERYAVGVRDDSSVVGL